MSAIVCDQVTKQYSIESPPAVDHVSFEVDGGALVVQLGPSGCGKTTLLRMVNRLCEPTSGRIFVQGMEVHDLPATDLRRRIGYVIQHVGLFPHMTVEQNIAVVPELLAWKRSRIDARIDDLLDLVELPRACRRRYPRMLSGGEQQRVGIARALAADPAILLMDEPFGALDAINRARLQDELLRLQRRLKKTILFVTHDVEEALCLADKLIIMRSGRILQYDTPLNIVSHPREPFVQELVGAGNLLRRLSLMNVQMVMEARRAETARRAEPGSPLIQLADDLRFALARSLEGTTGMLAVVDSNGLPCGRVTLEDLRAMFLEPKNG